MKRTRSPQEEVKRLPRQARRLDKIAFRLARGRPVIDVALGEILLRLSVGDRLLELDCSKQVDLANEKLGLPPRKFYALCEFAAALRERPLLRQAVLAGEVATVKARMVMARAIGEEEAGFVTAAMEMTVKELQKLVGGDEVEAPASYRTLRYRMTAEQQDRLDAALSLAKEMVGYDATTGKMMEALAREWLSSWKHLGGEEPEETCCGTDPEWLREMKRKGDEVAKQLRAVFEAAEVLEREAGDGETALGLLARAHTLLARREKFDEPLGRVLLPFRRKELWRWLGYEDFAEYCRERLGVSESTVNQRIRLEERMKELPPLRQALKSGRITYTKALVVARQATPLDIRERIAEAASTTWQQTDRKARAEEDKEDRQAERRKVRGPAGQLRVLMRAVDSVRQFFALQGEKIDDGEALARVADHFFAVYELPIRRSEWRTKWQKDVFLRHGGLCAVPGCTRAAKHLHHIVYKERGGPDKPWNLLALCFAHHRRGIHAGRLTVRGRGGEYLVWSHRRRELMPPEDWITRGADDVRRADAVRMQ